MEKLKRLSRVEVEEIATKNKVDMSDITGIIDEWEDYDYLHDSFEEFKEFPFPKRDELPWSKDPKEWAKLSLFYYANRKEIELLEPKIFKKSRFIRSGPLKADPLELSEFVTNHIIKTYLEKMAKENLLFKKEEADKISNYHNRMGKRFNDTFIKRDIMIKIAANYLKSKKVKFRTPTIRDLLSKMGFGELSLKYIRKIIRQS